MKKDQLLGAAVAIPLLIGMAWFLYLLMTTLVDADNNVKTAIIGAVAAFGTLLFTFWKDRRKAFQEAHRERKIEVYSIFFDMIFELLKATKDSTSEVYTETDEFKEKTYKLMRGVVFYGSPKVVLAYGGWTTQIPSGSETPGPQQGFRAIGKLLLAMREDIGLSNVGLNEINIHQVYVNEDLGKMGLGE